MAIDPQYYGYYQQGLLDEGVAPPAISGPDFVRGLKYAPFDLLGAPVDLANMALSPLGLGSDMPVGGSDYLINKYADLGDLLGVNYDRPTGSGSETLGRITSGILAPTLGAKTVGRVVQGVGDYVAGAPARVADRARSVTLGSGIDPTAALDDLIVRGMGDNGGPPMAPEAPVRDVDELGFYSQALEVAQGLKQKKGTGQQFESMLLKGGVKPDEIAFTPGLRGLLDQPQVTQEELVGLLQDQRIRPQETVLEGAKFESLNFPARADVLTPEQHFDPIDLQEEIEDALHLNTDAYVEAAFGGKKTEKEIEDLIEKIDEVGFPTADDIGQETLDALYSVARDQIFEEYNMNPTYRLVDPDTGFKIIGNDVEGFDIFNADGDRIAAYENSIAEARVRAQDLARDFGVVSGGFDDVRFNQPGMVEEGGTNYRENLFQIPEYEGMTREFYEKAHFDEPNIAVHTRTTDRNTESGVNDVLYAEELQSDWGQQGRKYGFDTPKDREKLAQIKKQVEPIQQKLNNAVDERDAFYRDFMNKIAKKVGGVKITNDEFDKDYAMAGLAIKAKDGSELLSRSEVNALMRGTDQVALTADGRELPIDPSNFDGVDIATKMGDLDFRIRSARDELDNTRGEFRADIPIGPLVGNSEKFAEAGIKRLLMQAANEGKRYVSFSPGDLQADRWNNPGLEVYYDEIIPKVAKKVAKRFDKDAFTGNKYIEELGDRFTIEITPKMREAIQKGVPLFTTGGAGLLGAGMAREERSQPAEGIL